MKRKDAMNVTECPFLNLDDHRCRAQFSLKTINQTFDMCLDRFRACSVYYALSREKSVTEQLTVVAEVAENRAPIQLEAPRVEVTVNGREVSSGHAA